jgi:hypothetical protein
MEKRKMPVWQLLFAVIPLVTLSFFGNELAKNLESPDIGFLFTGAFGGIGVLLGLSVHSLVKNKKTIYKVFTLIAFESTLVFAAFKILVSTMFWGID